MDKLKKAKHVQRILYIVLILILLVNLVLLGIRKINDIVFWGVIVASLVIKQLVELYLTKTQDKNKS
ncbi:MAG: hypothetical protein V1859_05245 [archaeon]